jgi:glyceraldehyde-3-phosphate dehydrogenase/erythrose-4-phosphate dehydrogenase
METYWYGFRVPTTDVSVVDLTVKVAKRHTKSYGSLKLAETTMKGNGLQDLVVSLCF